MRRRKIGLCVLYVKLRKRDYQGLAETEGGRVEMRRLFRRSAKLRRREDPSGVCTSRDGEERRQSKGRDGSG
jgi:hypothetical protein